MDPQQKLAKSHDSLEKLSATTGNMSQAQSITDASLHPIEIRCSTANEIAPPNSDQHPATLMAALAHESALKQVLLNALEDGIFIIDADDYILEANSAAATLLGIKLDDLPQQHFTQVCYCLEEENRQKIANPIANAIAHPDRSRSDSFVIVVADNGTESIVQMTAHPLSKNFSEPCETVVILRNVTKNRVLSQQLQWQAHHDSITGLMNRIHFEEVVARALKSAHQDQQPSVLAQLDIDDFKVINDTCGHFAGDQLLGQLAIVLQDHIRATDWLARLGGDEFGILFHHCSLEEAQGIIVQLQKRLQQFRFPYAGKSLTVEMSIGLAQINHETVDIATILSTVDTACYTAKRHGKNRSRVFSIHDVEMGALKRHQEWNLLIRDAIEENRFILYRQPIVSIAHNDALPRHYEVLIRMLNPEGEMISPEQFIPTAERYNLMPILDQWVVQHCLSRLELAMEQSLTDLDSFPIYAINLSGASLSDQQFLGTLTEAVSCCNIPAEKICFEITETAAIANVQQVKDFMKALKQIGCRFSLDDFGAGMSSFGYLSALPVDFVKIDGKFIQDFDADPANITIVESIVHVSKSLGLTTIAERVEDKSIAYRLKDIGVDFIQGFGVGRPHRWIE